MANNLFSSPANTLMSAGYSTNLDLFILQLILFSLRKM